LRHDRTVIGNGEARRQEGIMDVTRFGTRNRRGDFRPKKLLEYLP
jgi:hypothetical protein